MDTQTETTEDTSTDVVPEEATTEVTPEREVPRETAPERQTTRQDRKRQRIDVEAANKERDEFRKQLESERGERERMAREFAELRGRFEERQSQGQQQDRHAETKQKINNLRTQAWAQMALAAQAKDAESSTKFRDEYQRLMDEADDLRDEMRSAARWEKQRGEIASQMPDQNTQAEVTFLNSRFPALASDTEAQIMSDARLRYLIGQGRPATRETAVEAITWAFQQLKRGGTTAPTNGQRQLYAGVPAGEGAGGDERPRSIKMGRHEEALARAAYPKLEAKEAYKQWAKDMVSQMNDQGDE